MLSWELTLHGNCSVVAARTNKVFIYSKSVKKTSRPSELAIFSFGKGTEVTWRRQENCVCILILHSVTLPAFPTKVQSQYRLKNGLIHKELTLNCCRLRHIMLWYCLFYVLAWWTWCLLSPQSGCILDYTVVVIFRGSWETAWMLSLIWSQCN